MLAAALVTPVLVGCGGHDAPTRAEDTSASPTTPESTSSSGSVDFTKVALLSMTAAGGRVSPRATVVDDAGAATRFAAQFRGEALGNRLQAAVRKADVPQGRTLVASVVAIGCDVPPGVTVEKVADGVAIVPLKVTSPLPECLAAVTTVALVAVDSSAV
jgi:hypothetical protein